MAIVLLLAASLGLSPAVHAETFYKWKDDSGVWAYGAHPPPGVQAIEIKTTSTKARPSDTASGQAEQAVASGGGGTLEVEIEKKAKNAKRNAEYCETATANLEALSSKAVIRRRDAEGNITTISEKERQEEIDKAKLAQERYCK